MKCYICNGENPEYQALVNKKNKKKEKICSECSKQTKNYCAYCSELKLTKDMKFDQNNYLNCNKCAEKNLLKCSFCELMAICYCQCDPSKQYNSPESVASEHNQVPSQFIRNISQPNLYGINNLPHGYDDKNRGDINYRIFGNQNANNPFTTENLRGSNPPNQSNKPLKPQYALSALKSPAHINSGKSNLKTQDVVNPVIKNRSDANSPYKIEGNNIPAQLAENKLENRQSAFTFCRECAEKHFYTEILKNDQHQFVMFGIKSFTPDFLDLSIDCSKIEKLESANNKESLNFLKQFCYGSTDRKYTGNVLNYYFNEFRDYQIFYEVLMKPENNECPEVNELRLIFAEIYLFTGKKTYGLDIINCSQNSLLNPFNYSRICTYYLSKAECLSLPPLAEKLELIKQTKNLYDALEYYTVTAKLRYIFKNTKTKARSLKDAISENLLPSMTKVRAMVTYCKITKKIKFIESAIEYVKTYFQGIPELAWLINMKVKILGKTTMRQSLLESSMQILCRFYGSPNYFEAKSLYQLALYENESSQYYISMQAIKLALDLGEMKIVKKCFKILESFPNEGLKMKLQEYANLLDYIPFQKLAITK